MRGSEIGLPPLFLRALILRLALALLALFGASNSALALVSAETAFGEWLTTDGKAVVRVANCGNASLCGEIIWLRNEVMSGETLRDRSGAPLRGAQILFGFRRKENAWIDGRVRALNEGKTYRARLLAISPNQLRLDGCFGPFCKGQVWTRVDMRMGFPVSAPTKSQVAGSP